MKLLLPLLALLSFPVMAATGISVDSLISMVVYIVVIGLILWLCWWFIGFAGLPEPFNKVARVLIGLVAFVLLLYLLLGFLGPMPHFR